MLTNDELIREISKIIVKTKVEKLTAILDKQQFALRDLIDLTFCEDSNIAFRAAWILENLFLKKPEAYMDELEYLVSRVPCVTYPSCKRHYAKIMMHISARKAPASIRQRLEAINLEPVVEKLFDWLIDPKVLIAVKVFASDALFNMRSRYPWISEELKEQMKFLMRDGSAAIQTRGRKLLAKL
ncbi:MAG TPA: hypothetical protein VG367_04650 [Mucilaginibacter sp.]|jgi:hypothetical protein|nr:hypothetical protein [Mucilaginibacter sp.]